MTQLSITHFICYPCNTRQTVESKGEVLTGPCCRVCGKRMRKVVPTQLELDLFSPDKRGRKGKKGQ